MNRLVLMLWLLLVPTAALAQASPDNSRVPPLASIRDSAGDVWTLAPGTGVRAVLRNGVAAGGGVGSLLLMWQGTVWTVGVAGWWRFNGFDWTPGSDPSVPPAPPIPVTGASRLGWVQPGQTVAQAVSGVATLYVDGVGNVLAGVVCAVVSAATDCQAPLPALMPGDHTLAVTYTPKGGVETEKSNVLDVTTNTSLTPTRLGLRP